MPTVCWLDLGRLYEEHAGDVGFWPDFDLPHRVRPLYHHAPEAVGLTG